MFILSRHPHNKEVTFIIQEQNLCPTEVWTDCSITVVNNIDSTQDSPLHYQRNSFPNCTILLTSRIKFRAKFKLSSKVSNTKVLVTKAMFLKELENNIYYPRTNIEWRSDSYQRFRPSFDCTHLITHTDIYHGKQLH